MAVERIDVQSRMFDGYARVIFFPTVDPSTFTSTTTLADVLKNGKDLGRIVEGSPSWDGDEASVEALKDTEGGIIRVVNTPGTFAWSCRIPHSKETAKLVGGTTHTVTSLGDDFSIASGEDVIGLNPEDMDFRCPVGVLNLTHKELALLPKGSLNFSPGTEDNDLWQYNVSATAESIKTPNLDTLMFIPLASDPLKVEAGAGA